MRSRFVVFLRNNASSIFFPIDFTINTWIYNETSTIGNNKTLIYGVSQQFMHTLNVPNWYKKHRVFKSADNVKQLLFNNTSQFKYLLALVRWKWLKFGCVSLMIASSTIDRVKWKWFGIRSPDIKLFDYYLQGFMKAIVNGKNSRNWQHLKQETTYNA